MTPSVIIALWLVTKLHIVELSVGALSRSTLADGCPTFQIPSLLKLHSRASMPCASLNLTALTIAVLLIALHLVVKKGPFIMPLVPLLLSGQDRYGRLRIVSPYPRKPPSVSAALSDVRSSLLAAMAGDDSIYDEFIEYRLLPLAVDEVQ